MIACLINGQESEMLAVNDRGFYYGDGVFETIMCQSLHLHFWSQHYARLKISCQRLGILVPDESLLLSDIKKLVIKNNPSQTEVESGAKAVIKIIISRGQGGRGYLADANMQPTRVVSLHAWSNAFSEQQRQKGINVRLCQHRLIINPALVGIKHLNRLDQVMARNEWQGSDFQEGIMLDADDNLLEGTASNLFLKQNDQWFTAADDKIAVAGIMRDAVITKLKTLKQNIVIAELKAKQLSSVTEGFVCNSVWGVVAVKQLAGQVLQVSDIGLDLHNTIQKELINDIQQGSSQVSYGL